MVALLDHDAQKVAMLQFVGKRLTFVRSQSLVTTDNMGKMLEENGG